MTKLTVRHRTTYSYRRKVELAPHRLMLRSRERRELHLLAHEISTAPSSGARIVSGYLFNPVGGLEGSPDRGSTHAWAEIFVPGAGWIPFDPTNRRMGGEDLIPVAVGRDISQVVPVAGSSLGPSDACAFMQVDVEVLSGNVSDMRQAKNGNHQAVVVNDRQS